MTACAWITDTSPPVETIDRYPLDCVYSIETSGDEWVEVLRMDDGTLEYAHWVSDERGDCRVLDMSQGRYTDLWKAVRDGLIAASV